MIVFNICTNMVHHHSHARGACGAQPQRIAELGWAPQVSHTPRIWNARVGACACVRGSVVIIMLITCLPARIDTHTELTHSHGGPRTHTYSFGRT